MKSFLATSAIVLIMGGAAYAQSAQINSYQAQATDIEASDFIGQRVYATDMDVSADTTVQRGAEKDWDNVGEINDVIIGRDGAIKAVVLGVGGFLGIGEKNVALSMQDIRFVRNGDGANDYFLVVNTTKEALNSAPAYQTPTEVAADTNASTANDDMAATDTGATTADPATDQAANTTGAADTTGQVGDQAANTTGTATTDDNAMSNDTASNATGTVPTADSQNDQASSTSTTGEAMSNDTAANTTTTGTATDDAANQQAADNNAARTDMQTTGATTTNDAFDKRPLLTRPDMTPEGYQAADLAELTADKLTGARVYGPNDEDIGEVNRLVLNNNSQVQLVVLDIGGFLGVGEREIAVTPEEINIVRNSQGDDLRVYVDANKDALMAQPEYKAPAE